MGDNYDL